MTQEYKRVPVEPTDEMIHAADSVVELDRSEIQSIWSAMLAAAPAVKESLTVERDAIRNADLTNEQPKVPGNICQLIEAYGNARDDHDISSPALCELLTALREWGASLKSQPAQPSDRQAEPSDTEMLNVIRRYADCRVMASKGRATQDEVTEAWLEVKAAMRAEREGS